MKKEKSKAVGTPLFYIMENNAFRVILGIVVFVVLSMIFLAIGLVIGFSVIGDGRAIDVFQWYTWQHILDFIK